MLARNTRTNKRLDRIFQRVKLSRTAMLLLMSLERRARKILICPIRGYVFATRTGYWETFLFNATTNPFMFLINFSSENFSNQRKKNYQLDTTGGTQ